MPYLYARKARLSQERQRLRQETVERFKANFDASKSVAHWDGKLLPDLSIKYTEKIDHSAVLLFSLENKSTELLGVPKLLSRTGKATTDAFFELLKSR